VGFANFVRAKMKWPHTSFLNVATLFEFGSWSSFGLGSPRLTHLGGSSSTPWRNGGSLSSTIMAHVKKYLSSHIMLTPWEIWNERNPMVFHHVSTMCSFMMQKIKIEVVWWSTRRREAFRINFFWNGAKAFLKALACLQHMHFYAFVGSRLGIWPWSENYCVFQYIAMGWITGHPW
jgi:hypothetical protein